MVIIDRLFFIICKHDHTKSTVKFKLLKMYKLVFIVEVKKSLNNNSASK